MRKLVIFGISDLAQIAHTYFAKDSDYSVVAFTVHERYMNGQDSLFGLEILPFESLAVKYPPGECSVFVAMGFKGINRARADVYNQCKAKGYELATYVSSKAILWGGNEIGDNCFILEANVIQPFVKIGNDVVLWSGNHVGHHSIINDHCFIASHAVISGNVTIGEYSFVGVNATFRDGITVAPGCVIGAAATILKDTVENGVYASRSTELSPLKASDLRGF